VDDFDLERVKEASAQALSKQLPLPLMLQTSLRRVNSAWY
jgi:hypothetical protein